MAANPYTRPWIYERSAGALILGANFQCIMYGILLGLACAYYKRSAQDPKWLQTAVLFAWLLCTICCTFILHGVYWFTVINYDNPSALQHNLWSIALLPTMLSVVMAIVRFVFLCHVYRLYKDKINLAPVVVLLVVLVALLSLANLGCASALTAQYLKVAELSSDMFKVMFGAGIAADLILSVMLCASLRLSPSELQRTDTMMNRFIVYAMTTGIVACGCAIVTLIVYLWRPHVMIFATLYLQTVNLYLVSLLATLNYCEPLRLRVEQPLGLDYAASAQYAAPSGQRRSSDMTEPPVSVHSRLSLAKPLRILRMDSRKKSIASDFEENEKNLVYQRQSSDVILDSVVDLRPCDSSDLIHV
ncbi:hypothetical protein DAEQUDRAFT_809604 [Daedalea quercina L-15889]|uniref:DUF6534 domain-containing protein n=1 Tax=Daedalea quercina L-15889 TaxID=1314783 RepID=A0A165SHN8_9APHY|nr:hypothetical protein DAEQUDRAFT_809604 [Daedalea quercina L-15889]